MKKGKQIKMRNYTFQTSDGDITLPSSSFNVTPCKNDSIVLNYKTYIVRERILNPKADEILFVLEEK